MYKWTMSALLIVAIVLGAGVLMQNISDSMAAAEQEQKEAGTTIKISASNFKFDKEEYRVKKGETWTLKFVNKEGVHAMEIVGMDVHLDKANDTAEVTFNEAGEFVLECSLMCGIGHDDMKSKFIVEE